MPTVESNTLGAFLSGSFSSLTLLAESAGKSVWRGRRGTEETLIRCFADWWMQESEIEALQLRHKVLMDLPWSCLPRPYQPATCEGYLLLFEEWVCGNTWDQTALSREGTLESGKELFDLLAELEDLGIVHGRISSRQLLLEEKTGRLKLLGLAERPPDEECSTEKDRLDALACLRSVLKPEEMEAVSAIRSSREISAKLSELLCQYNEAVSEPELVGRDWALRTLTRHYSEAKMVAVRAPGGGGKTHLLRSWCRHLEDRVLRGKAQSGVAPSPFQLFAEPFEQLEKELTEDESLLRELRRELPVTLPLVNSLTTESGQFQHAAVHWLVKLFSCLHRFRPTVLLLEDVHWADPFTLNFLQHWAAEGSGAFLVLSFRPDELPSDHPLFDLPTQNIDLPPLSAAQAERLLRSMRPTASRTLIESALKKSEGNPFLLIQYLRSGHIQGDLEELGLSTLPKPSQEALAVAALLGTSFELDLLEHCLGCPPLLEPAVEAGLLGRDQDHTAFFLHDRYREVSLGILNAQAQAERHLQVAKAYEKRGDSYRVAYHYRQAARSDLGVTHALTAAELSRSHDDLNTAVFYLRTALEGMSPADPTRPSIDYQLGDCYRLLGHYQESVRCFLKVLAQTEDAEFKARVLHVLGDVYFKQDELRKAREAIVEGLALLGVSQPKWEALALALQACRLTASQLFKVGASRPTRDRDLLKASLFNRLAYVNWFLEGPIPSIRAHFCELSLAERHGDSAELARAQANHAIAMSAIPWWSRARRYGEQAVVTAERIQDKWSQGRVRHFYGAVLLGEGRLEEAEAVFAKAAQLLQQTGDRWEENGVRYHLAVVYYRQGRMAKAHDLAAATQKIGVDIGDRLAAGDNLYTWARALNGDIPRDVLEREKEYQSPDLQRTCEMLGAEAILCLRESKPEQAVILLEQAVAHYESKMVRNLYAASLPCWLATARRLYLQNLPHPERQNLLGSLKKATRIALREARKFQTNLPHALRESGLYCGLTGSLEDCRRLLRQSLEEADRQGQTHERKLTTAALRQLGWLLGTPASSSEKAMEFDCPWLLELGQMRESLEQFALDRLLHAATGISNSLSEVTALYSLAVGCVDALQPVAECAIVRRQARCWELVVGSSSLPTDPELYRGGGRHALVIPDLDQELHLLLCTGERSLHEKSLDVLQFLISVAVSALDRARRTAASTLLRRDLTLSSLRLDENARRLSRAKEQLLLGERLAITGRLATGLVHDLKNLNMSVTGTAEFLKSESPESGALEALDDIIQAGKKAIELLDRLSRINQGEAPGARVIDLEHRLLEAKPLLLSLCGPAVTLKFQLKPALCSKLDPIQLDRILLNLVVNARDAVRFGGHVTVSLASVVVTSPQDGYPNDVPKGEYCKLCVKDDGCGIPQEALPQIFDLHFTTKGSAGTGVGLATVLEMVEANNGFIAVKTGSQGTLFELYFPLSQEPGRLVPAAG